MTQERAAGQCPMIAFMNCQMVPLTQWQITLAVPSFATNIKYSTYESERYLHAPPTIICDSDCFYMYMKYMCVRNVMVIMIGWHFEQFKVSSDHEIDLSLKRWLDCIFLHFVIVFRFNSITCWIKASKLFFIIFI